MAAGTKVQQGTLLKERRQMAATRRGKAVLDCGATDSLGSINAVESLAKINVKKTGLSKMRVNLGDRPTYTFGNGDSQRVAGRATFEVSACGDCGTIDFHGLDAKGVPLLLGAKAMKEMGAIIDFDSGKAVFAKLCPDRVVQLEASSSGHWLLDLSEDLYANEVKPEGCEKLLGLAAVAKEPSE